MDASLDVNHFGPRIDYRESSFWRNPRLTPEVNNSRAIVEVCTHGNQSSDCSDGSSPAVLLDGRVRIQSGLTSDAIQAALSGVIGFKVLMFQGLSRHAFGGYSAIADQRKFERRMAMYASIWCCIKDNPGHIWYDLMYDMPGHRDKHHRLWEGEWYPKTGP